MHIDFQKTFDLFMRQVVCNIRIQFGITVKLFLVIKYVSMNLSYIQNRQKFAWQIPYYKWSEARDAASPVLCNFDLQ